MPFTRRSAYKLSLAISAALLSQLSAAETPTGSWSCVATEDGQWDCGGPAPVAPTPSAPRVPAAAGGDETGSARLAAPTALPADGAAAASPGLDAATTGADDGQAGAALPAPETPATTAAAERSLTDVDEETAADNPYAHLDWYPYPEGEQPGLCRGRYIQPQLEFSDSGIPFNLQPVLIAAASSQSELGGLTQLDGGVELSQGGRQLSAEYAEFDQLTQLIRLEGRVRYRERGVLLLSDAAQTNLNNLETIFSQSQYVLHPQHARGYAERILRLEDGRIRIEDGAYTQCEPGSNSWRLAADSITLNTETGFGEARGATLEVLDTPVLYVPWFYFPIDDRRVSGFLYPSINYSSSSGLDLAVPYYFNLAPNFDDTLTPRIITEHGLMLENEFRYLNRWSHNVLSNAILVDDDETGDNRWLLGFDHEGQPWKGWESFVDYTAVSDNDYFDDLDPTNLEIGYRSHLNKLGELRYEAPDWSFTARAHSYQTLSDDDKSPYRRLPQFLLEGDAPGLPGGLDASYIAEYVHFDRDDEDPLLTAFERMQGDRVHLRPGISLPLANNWGYLKPSLSIWATQYQLDNAPPGFDDKPTVTTTVASLDSGLVFEREAVFGDNRYRQTLEPRAFYLNVPQEDQDDIPAFDTSELDFRYDSLFRENRFSGRDRIGDANQLSLGIASRFYEDSGLERFSVALGQALYFDDREVQLVSEDNPTPETQTESRSNYAFTANWTLTEDLRLNHDSEWDQDSFGSVAHNYRVTFSPKDDRMLYGAYRQRDDVREQMDVGMRWPLTQEWNMLARWRQDLDRSDTLDALVGLEYKDCCWKVRFGYRQWLKDDDGDRVEDEAVLVQFVLRGLGSVGDDETTQFITEITGFDEGKDEEF
ncbi:LPS-assembly protein LptD [Marinobacterium nitratireducens]|uniref:LPS-assembly protein LptD n=1 Tax=Marinobacterium nitratireducens TaxID=518897 RepID=A0A917ZP98_9GAMM|nr:LPS-assembly protein LptD [Marinobacterium nitratireducens]GGO86389.1 LPS-assembly protein LptD [Marinobacterium nitratireducens]